MNMIYVLMFFWLLFLVVVFKDFTQAINMKDAERATPQLILLSFWLTPILLVVHWALFLISVLVLMSVPRRVFKSWAERMIKKHT
ncbi:hypothetical protein FJZ53_02145 [Candidatus Woesearchaeota archaeon]|nr:hypothetical protein [Candidatus Woesearchaeota archaeon]